MNILIINGSPKGQYSTTLHTCLYLQALHQEHQYDVVDAGATIRKIEKNFDEVAEKLK